MNSAPNRRTLRAATLLPWERMMAFDWREVWERKGKSATTDLREISGYEHTTVDIGEAADQIKSALAISATDRVLEVGCGAGFLAQHIACDYVGVDYAESMLNKHVALLDNSVVRCEADRLPFCDKAFDVAYAFSVFHYFPDIAYARAALEEMLRVTSRGVFVGDLPRVSHRAEHLLFKSDWFEDWTRSEGFYNPDRFNIWLGRDCYANALRRVLARTDCGSPRP